MEDRALESSREKASYCLGYQAGRELRTQFSDLDLDLFMHGLRDAFAHVTPRLKEEEIQQVIGAVRHQLMEQQKEFLAKVSDENKRLAEQFLQENRNKPGVVVLSSGLQYQILQTGQGGKTPMPLDVVVVHYSVATINGSVFESTFEKGQPKVVPLAQAISAWTEALKLMTIGDRWRLFSPPYLAYGEAGYPPFVLPNSLLIFELELVGIQ